MSNLSHDEAIDAICNCASSVSVLSYQEAIEGYFKLRGLLIPPAPSLAAQDGLVESLGDRLFNLSAKLNETGFLKDDANHAAYEKVVAAFNALSAIKGDINVLPG